MILKSYRTILFLSLFFVMTIGASVKAHADIYSIENVTVPFATNFAGGDDFGDYSLFVVSPVCGLGNPCYYTSVGGATSISADPPVFPSDPNPRSGTDTCAVTEAGFSVSDLGCNNGHVLFFGTYTEPDGSEERGLWSGSDPNPLDNLLPGGAVIGALNVTASGTAYFVDTLNDQFYVAVDDGPSPVPEPNSLILMGTGALAVFGTIRRKMVSR